MCKYIFFYGNFRNLVMRAILYCLVSTTTTIIVIIIIIIIIIIINVIL